MSDDQLKRAVDYLGQLPREQVIQILTGRADIDRGWKNLIVLYLFPEPLPPFGLPDRINSTARTEPAGEISLSYVARIIEACRTGEYGRFMMHLMYSFVIKEIPWPVQESGIVQDCITRVDLALDGTWDRTDVFNRAFGASNTKHYIGLDSLVQLREAYRLMKVMDPDWMKRGN